jgi:hypothetical protein
MKKELMLEAVNDITDSVKDYKTIKIVSRSVYYYRVLLNGVVMNDQLELPLQEKNVITVPDKNVMSMLTITVELG